LHPSVQLEPAPPVEIELKPGETVASALITLRSEIVSLRQRLHSTRYAALPREDQKRMALEFVVAQVRTAAPRFNIVADQVRLSWRDSVIASADDVFALITALAPTVVLEALERQIDAAPERPDALTVDERTQRVAQLESELDAMERREESLVQLAQASGLECPRRPDAAPQAVLGVAIVEAAQAVAAE